MNRHNEVNKERFRNNRHRTVANILYTYNNVALRLQKMLNGYNLTLQQYNILRILGRQYPEPACNCTIREQMFDSRSDITRIVDRLIKEGLVVRNPCGNDRRRVNITITEKGIGLLDRMEVITHKMDGIVGSLSDDELTELNRLLEKVHADQ